MMRLSLHPVMLTKVSIHSRDADHGEPSSEWIPPFVGMTKECVG